MIWWRQRWLPLIATLPEEEQWQEMHLHSTLPWPTTWSSACIHSLPSSLTLQCLNRRSHTTWAYVPPPMSNTQYYQLADNDYTKLDESISDSDPEANTPPPQTPHSNNSTTATGAGTGGGGGANNMPTNMGVAVFSYDINGAHSTTVNNNRNSTINAHPQHSNNSPTTSTSFIAGGTLPPTSGDQLNRPRGLEATTSTGGTSAISRPRMRISSTIPAALGRSVASLPPYATNDVCWAE